MRAEKPPSQLGLEDEVFGSRGTVFAHLPQPVARHPHFWHLNPGAKKGGEDWLTEGQTRDRHEGGGGDCTETGREREIEGREKKAKRDRKQG